ncbi:MAG: hypothetical protein IJU74_01870 [Bacteroidales bacterium]|nr:hypothetical protein [Bacteroidales bacterium]
MNKNNVLRLWQVVLAVTLTLCPLMMRAQGVQQLPAPIDFTAVPTPNAAQMLRFGKVPVNYFNGLPVIEIPLLTFHAKGYDLPVSLSYHAGGNRPDQHPGWVGLGWNLSANYRITRTINGRKDEMSEFEIRRHPDFYKTIPSYLEICDSTQNLSWNADDFVEMLEDFDINDYEPDEFVVSAPGLSASFYITGENEVRIVSKEAADFRVVYSTDQRQDDHVVYLHETYPGNSLCSYLFTYIKELVITNCDGIRYYFGGDESAIEFSTKQKRPSVLAAQNHDENNPFEWDAVSTATSWMLKKMVLPNGEDIRFDYERKGVVLQKTVNDYEYGVGDIIHGWMFTTPRYISGGYSTQDLTYSPYANTSIEILEPLYLTKITSKMTKDTLFVSSTPSVELADTFSSEEMTYVIGDFSDTGGFSIPTMLSRNYYMQLDAIEYQGKRVDFSYTDNASTRLKLTGLTISGGSGQTSSMTYGMQYNQTSLPAYNARQNDHWGYYNGRSYGDVNYHLLETTRIPDETKMQAEMLTRLTYPTGGWTDFEYEAHRYGKVALQYPFGVEAGSGMGGGLRIKKITSHPTQGRDEVVRYVYETETGGQTVSTGILSGYPRYYFNGYCDFTQNDYYKNWNHASLNTSGNPNYYFWNQTPYNALSTTFGNHVTYSEVTEIREGAGKTVYSFTNHDSPGCTDGWPYPEADCQSGRIMSETFNSRELQRGLLAEKKTYDEAGVLKLSETNTYHQDTSVFIPSVCKYRFLGVQLQRVYLKKIFCYTPHLLRTVTRVWPESGAGTPVQTVTDYVYNSRGQLAEKTVSCAADTLKERYTWTGDIPSGMCHEMTTQGMAALPVEHVTRRNGVVQSASLVTYKRNALNNGYVPEATWACSPGIVGTAFTMYDGETKDPSYGADPAVSYLEYDVKNNLLAARTRDSLETTWHWTPDGLYPAMQVRNALSGKHAGTMVPQNHMEEYDLYTNGDWGYDIPFYAETAGTLTVNYTFRDGYETSVWGRLDENDSTAFHFPLAPNGPGFVHTHSIPVSAGVHILQLSTREGVFHPFATAQAPPLDPEPGEPGEPVVIINPDGVPLKGTASVTYPVLGPQTITLYETYLTSFGDSFHTGEFTFLKQFNPAKGYYLDCRRRLNGWWQYVREPFIPDATNEHTVGTSGVDMDDIRIYPCDAMATSYEWDARGRLTGVTDARGVRERYEYDGLDRLIRVRNNDGEAIKTWSYSMGLNANSIRECIWQDSDEESDHIQKHVHYDGLGREYLSCMRGYNMADIVTMTAYDAAGRPWRTWNPVKMGTPYYVAPYDSTAVAGAAATFYSDARPFTEMVYDGSPLDRVKEQYGPGAAWYSAGKAVKNAFLVNSATTDSLKVYRCSVTRSSSNPLSLTVQSNGYYPASSLTVERTEDEDGGTLLTFKDFTGRTVLERRKGTGLFGGVAWLDTYYIYDACGTLACVLPPMAGTDSRSMEKYAWQYAYDDRGRCIARKAPGAGWTKYVYDAADRVVATQDPVQAGSGEWSFSIPDKLGRECLRGTLGTGFNAIWGAETTLTAERTWPQMTAGGLKGYTVSGTLTTADFTGADILQVNYYDDYSFITANSLCYTPEWYIEPVAVGLQPDTAADALYFPGTSFGDWYGESAAGLATGSLVKLLDNSQNNEYLWNVAWYDDKGRPVLTKGLTHRGGVERARFGYTFTGNPDYKGLVHTDAFGTEMKELYSYTYDGLDRPLKTFHRIGISGGQGPDWNGAVTLLSDKQYDDAGRLLSESRNGASGLATLYTYDVRSRMTGTSGPWSESLTYTWGGRAASQQWGTGAGNTPNKFVFSYDRLGRLTGSQYSLNNVADATKSSTYTYDNHGNLTQRQTGSGGYSYTLEGNRMTDVSEITAPSGGGFNPGGLEPGPLPEFPEFPGPGIPMPVTTVFYDALGRLTGDDTADILSVVYNKIGQPMQLVEGNSQMVSCWEPHTVSYLYAADGRKLCRRDAASYNPSRISLPVVTVRDYVGNLVYEWTDEGMSGAILSDMMPKIVLLEGGFFTPSDHAYHFQVTDRQGNVRLVTGAGGTVEQSYDYHPYGEEFSAQALTGPANAWRYGGKEKETVVGTRPQYDFGARRMSPAYGRFTTMDPLGEKYYHISPYAYCAGDPVNYVDPTGMDVLIVYREKDKELVFRYTGKEETIPENEYVKSVIEAYKFNKENWEKAGFEGQSPSTLLVENSDYNVYLKEDYSRPSEYYQENGGIPMIRWNSYMGSKSDNGVIRSPASILAHEADHAIDDLTDARAHSDRRDRLNAQYGNEEEKRVITGSEQKTSLANGEIKTGQVTRRNHNGTSVLTIGPTSNIIDNYTTQYYYKNHKTH